MTYKPPGKKSQHSFESGFGPIGKSVVQFNSAGDKVRVQMEHTENGVLRNDIYVLLRSECPDAIQTGTWVVGLNKECNKVTVIKPNDGVFVAEFVDIRHKPEEPLLPRLREGKSEKGEWSYYYFEPVFEIKEGNATGMKMGYKWGLRYNFMGTEDEQGRLIVDWSNDITRSPYTQQLDEFMTVAGIWDKGPMPYKPNPPSILPYILARGLEMKKRIHIIVKNGFVETLAP